jgi:hypothetical protein
VPEEKCSRGNCTSRGLCRLAMKQKKLYRIGCSSEEHTHGTGGVRGGFQKVAEKSPPRARPPAETRALVPSSWEQCVSMDHPSCCEGKKRVKERDLWHHHHLIRGSPWGSCAMDTRSKGVVRHVPWFAVPHKKKRQTGRNGQCSSMSNDTNGSYGCCHKLLQFLEKVL